MRMCLPLFQITDGMSKLRAKAKESKAKLKEHKARMKEQLEQCQQLHASLKVLQLSKQERIRLETKAKEEERLRQDRLKTERKQKFRERQKEQWAVIRGYRRNQEEIKAERRYVNYVVKMSLFDHGLFRWKVICGPFIQCCQQF